MMREYCQHKRTYDGRYGQRSPRTENRVQPMPPPHPWRNEYPPRPPGPPPGKSSMSRPPMSSGGGESKSGGGESKSGGGESKSGANAVKQHPDEDLNFDPAFQIGMIDYDTDNYMTQLKYWLERQKGPHHRFEWLKEHKILDKYETWSNKKVIKDLNKKFHENIDFDPRLDILTKDLDYDEYMKQFKYWLERQEDVQKSDRFEWLKEHKILDEYEIWSNREIIEELRKKNSNGENLDFDPERDVLLKKAYPQLYRRQVTFWTLRTNFDEQTYSWLKSYSIAMYDVAYDKWQKQKIAENANTECAICLEDLKEGEKIKCCKNCHKCCHEECINAWLKRQSTIGKCPLCRQPFNIYIPRNR